MNPPDTAERLAPLRARGVFTWAAAAAATFCIAYASPFTSLFVVFYVFALLQLARAATWRKAFYPGLAVGFVIGAAQLGFFWTIFGPGAAALWLVFGVWIGFFAVLSRQFLRRFGAGWWTVIVPFLWLGLEYFRSELYFLRFAWCSPGIAFSFTPWLAPYSAAGAYGLAFLMVLLCALALFRFHGCGWKTAGFLVPAMGLILLWGWLASPREPSDGSAKSKLRVAGVQMEFPTEKEILIRLNELLRKRPETELIVLSEYTLQEPPSAAIKEWCRQKRRHLIIGGKDPAPENNFFNTAFVISPEGEIIFRQVKSVPIQFFKDGLPAAAQTLWNSPWGKIGICICYDLSYTRITDNFIRQGAEALIAPTMDVADWGRRQHELHARIAPVRAAEYGVPIFRVASSGISQLVGRDGRVLASSPFPGDGAFISGTLDLRGPGSLPLDRYLALAGVLVTAIVALWLMVAHWRERLALTGRATPTPTTPEPVGT
jgi:apolipoprotein N-acyltransferase